MNLIRTKNNLLSVRSEIEEGKSKNDIGARKLIYSNSLLSLMPLTTATDQDTSANAIAEASAAVSSK